MGSDTQRDERFLADWLADRDEPCPVCGYNLRSCTLPNCPECGEPIRLSITLTDPSPGPWLLAVISCALAAGFDLITSLIFSGVFVFGVLSSTQPPPPNMYLMFLAALSSVLIPGIASAVGLLVLLRRRKKWRRLTKDVRRRRGFLVFVIVALPHFVIGLFWFSRMIAL